VSSGADFGSGLHAAPGRPVDADAYEQYIGRWSRLFVPAVLAAAEVAPGFRVLDVASGPGEASWAALAAVGGAGLVVGADVSRAMIQAACARLAGTSFRPVVADGQALAFKDASFDAVVCQLGLQFFPDPACGLAELRRVLRARRRVAVSVLSTPDRAPVWGVLADVLGRHLPDRRAVLHLSFALADARRLEDLLRTAGFGEVRVTRESRRGSVASFDEYWAPIEAGTGQMPQAYLSLPEPSRRAVRAEVEARLSEFVSDGQLMLGIEILIGSGANGM
jgi:ubiquinone/menaquinone biosynthesis C-methylase UbiE